MSSPKQTRKWQHVDGWIACNDRPTRIGALGGNADDELRELAELVADANRGAACDDLLVAIRNIDTADWPELTPFERSRRWEALRKAVNKAGGYP